MRRRSIPGTDLELSVVGFGCWAAGGEWWGPVRDEDSIAAIRAARDHGIDWFDTAPLYGHGHADTILARALGSGLRDVTIATKVGVRTDGEHAISDLSPAHVRADAEASLRRLGVDTIELLQVHWPCERGTPLPDTLGTLQELRREGKIRWFGVCNYGPDEVRVARRHGAVTLQTPYHLLRREFEQGLRDATATDGRIGVAALGDAPADAEEGAHGMADASGGAEEGAHAGGVAHASGGAEEGAHAGGVAHASGGAGESAHGMQGAGADARAGAKEGAHAMGVLAYEPLCRGLLTGKFREPPRFDETDQRSWDERFEGARFARGQALVRDLAAVAARVGVPTAAVAIGWVLTRPGITAAVVGAKTPQQVAENARAAEILDRAKLWSVVGRIAAMHAV